MKMPLITMVHLLASRAGRSPGKPVSTNFALIFQFFAIAFARSTSNPTALPAGVLYSMGGKVGSLQYLSVPLIGDAAPPVPTATRPAIRARTPIAPKLRFMVPPSLADSGKQERALLLEHLARDHQPLNLVRPLVDLRDLRVPHHPLQRVLGDVAVTAEHLHSIRRHLHRHIRAVELGHRGKLRQLRSLDSLVNGRAELVQE